MDQIPASFYPIVIEELQAMCDTPETGWPVTLTREFLEPYGCTGSHVNPIVCPNLPQVLMMSYGNVFFTGSEKAIYIPQRNLIGSRLYLNKDGMFSPVSIFIEDPVVGIRLTPIYHKKERFHEYWDISLNMEFRDNVDIMSFTIGEAKSTLMHVKDGVEYITKLEFNRHLSEFRQRLNRINESQFQKLKSDIDTLHSREFMYLSTILNNSDIVCPYKHLQDIRLRCIEAKNYMHTINVRFSLLLEIPNPDAEDMLLELAKKLDDFNRYQIVKIISLGYWKLFEYLLSHPKFNQPLRKDVILGLLNNYRNLVAKIPDDLILSLYNWRNRSITDRLKYLLTEYNRWQTALLVSTAPFKPSRLRLAHNPEQLC